jgi:amino acid transporter
MYWTDAVPQWAWILIFWFLFLGLSNVGVREYGEMEFWLSLYANLDIKTDRVRLANIGTASKSSP